MSSWALTVIGSSLFLIRGRVRLYFDGDCNSVSDL